MKDYLLFGGLALLALVLSGCHGAGFGPTSDVKINETRNISAQSYKSWELPNMGKDSVFKSLCTLTGSVTSNGTVNVYIMNETNYINYTLGNQFQYINGSEGTTQFIVYTNETITPDIRYLVVDNNFLVPAQKNVHVTITEHCPGCSSGGFGGPECG